MAKKNVVSFTALTVDPKKRLRMATAVLEARAHQREIEGNHHQQIHKIEAEVRDLLMRWDREDNVIEEDDHNAIWLLICRWSAESV